MARGTCTVTNQGKGKWLTRCTKCKYKAGFTNWTAAATAGWRHRCG